MKTYYSCDFTGYYPVGTAAVVCANNEQEARQLLSDKLAGRGLVFDGTLTEIKGAGAVVLCDGDY
jgi:hypothetical protein